MIVAALLVLAVALAWPVPRAMADLTTFRRAPRAALVVWQATAIAAVLAALFAAPAALAAGVDPGARLGDTLAPVAVAALVSGAVAARLLLSGHRVGTRLRANRRRHRDLVDLLALQGDSPHGPHLRVLEHPTPTAYCVPGLQRRVVLTQGTIDALPPAELAAVLAHERAHLAARHDLILEFFTVAHEAVPPFVRSEAALREVNLLIEVLADRAAVRTAGVVATARAILAMAGGATSDGTTAGTAPEGTMAMSGSPSAGRLRLGLLEPATIAHLPAPVAATLMYLFAAALVAAPIALLALAWATG
jgi:Zn-dependent protease with chaperone function